MSDDELLAWFSSLPPAGRCALRELWRVLPEGGIEKIVQYAGARLERGGKIEIEVKLDKAPAQPLVRRMMVRLAEELVDRVA